MNWIFPQTSRGSFSAVSMPIFASKYSLESSRRGLHNALLCTVLQSQNFSQKSSTFFRDWIIEFPIIFIFFIEFCIFSANFWWFFSQKLTSWVFNDQPCECADVGQSRTIGRAAKIGWEKKLLRKLSRRFLSVKSLIGRFYWEETGDRRVVADPAARIRFYLHKEFRAAEIWFSLHTLFRGLCEIF